MPKRVIEAALFMSSEPLDIKQLSRLTGISSLGHLEEKLGELSREYESRGIEIVKTPEGWWMQVRQDILGKVAHLSKYSDLEEGHKRTLALVAYREPILQSKIVKSQGNKAYSYVKKLEKKGLVKTERMGRSKLVTLTREFERYFGDEKEKIRNRLIRTAERMEKEQSLETEKDPQKKITEPVPKEETNSGEEGKSEHRDSLAEQSI